MKLQHLWCLAFLLLGAKGNHVVEWELDIGDLLSSSPAENGADGAVGFLAPVGHYGGYFSINGTEDGHLFYLYFENRFHDPDAPLVLWTNGGPGCSSLFGLFLENGPYKIQDDLSLNWSDYGWDIGHNLLFVDHPLNVGYSYGSWGDRVTKEEQVAEHMLQFFYAFYEAHPEVKDKPLHLTGESFAGHYVPAIADRLMQANEEGEGVTIPLVGIALGDPWINPSLQYRSNPVYEHQMGLIDKETEQKWLATWKFCDYDLQLCRPEHDRFSHSMCTTGYYFCEEALLYPIFELYPSINYYDIRGQCLVDGCYDVSKLNAFMNLPKVRSRFQIPEHLEWKDCNDDVYFAMIWECAMDMTDVIGRLLDKGIRTLIYVGEQDLICNHIGVRDSVDAMEWFGTEGWKEASEEIWWVGEKRAGELKRHGMLTFLKIEASGHMVPYDQPEAALEMIQISTESNKTWATSPKGLARAQYIQV